MPYDENGEFALFENHNRKGDKSPDYTGTFELHGHKYRAVGWRRSDGRITGKINDLKEDRPNLPRHPE
jgi:hypothetical protein